MGNIDYNLVKRKIEIERCPEHSEHPKFEKTNKGFSVNACCEEFRSEMLEKIKIIMAEETKSAIGKMLKNAFK